MFCFDSATDSMSTRSALSDQELLSLMISGNEDAFAVLFEHHQAAVHAFIRRYVHSEPLTEDLTQEVFIKLWEGRKNLGHVTYFKGYLMITARNHTLNSLRAIAKCEAAMGEVVHAYAGERSNTDEELLDKDYRAFLDNILNSLPERTREIFKQCREQGRTYDEVAAELGISRNAVKNHMVHSMKVLRNSVEKELGISLSVLLAVIFRH